MSSDETVKPDNPLTKIKQFYPTLAYKEAREHLVYRLSELVFGSLLASYILGFVGATATQITVINEAQNFEALMPLLAQSFTYLLISVTFAYVTAGLYISYHSVILTRPTVPLNRMRWDFLVALLQAVCFGISLLDPKWFPFFLSISLWASVLRQNKEYKSLVEKLGEVRPRPYNGQIDFRSPEGDSFKNFIKETLISSELRIWLPVSAQMIGGTLLLSILGIGFVVLSSMVSSPTIHFIVLGVSFILFFLVLKGIFKLLRDKPRFVTERGLKELDESFEDLLDKIKNYNIGIKRPKGV